MKLNKILVVGPLPDYKNMLQFGGATVLMENFINYLKGKKIPFGLVQTNRFSNKVKGCNSLVNSSIWFFIMFFFKIWFYNIILFNFSDNSVIKKYPILLFISKLLGKKVVLHKFGGSFEITFKELKSRKINIVKNALNRTDLIFLETLSAIDHAKKLLKDNANIIWYPNVRKPTKFKKNPCLFNKKIVFLSHIADTKGIRELLAVRKLLDSDYEFNLYGAIKDEKYLNYNWDSDNVFYHGEIKSDLVPSILSESSILVLPSYSEGYPGIVIEALSVGLPVIVSNVGGIPEMITNNKEGILIPPQDVSALKKAIESVSSDNYSRMCNYALDTFNRKFNSEFINAKILDALLNL